LERNRQVGAAATAAARCLLVPAASSVLTRRPLPITPDERYELIAKRYAAGVRSEISGCHVRKVAAAVVGVDRCQRPRIPRHDVRRGTHRASDRQHHAPPALEAFADHGFVRKNTIAGTYDRARSHLTKFKTSWDELSRTVSRQLHEAAQKG